MKVDQGLCLGVLVNPYAGLGGSVALKGSDGVQTRDEALRRGAKPQAPGRMSRALKALSAATKVSVLTWGGDMGENSCRSANVPCTVIGESPMPSSPDDTRAAAAALKAAGAELILFAGGDGTARDLVDAIGLGTPVLGVPAGCKMHSAVYAINPEAAGELLARWGKRSRGLDGFSGCCNPVSVAVTDSGEFVTAERGQPRIKLFDKAGKFRAVIAGPEAFDVTEHEQVDTDAELATCQNGGIEVGLLGDQVVALDHTTASFRLFDLA